jgi:GGDEF domain-containing protein
VDWSEIATAAIAASAALSALVLGVLVVRGRRARADRRFESVLEQLDGHMGAISESLQRVVERSAEARAKGVDDLELTVDFDELLRRIAAEAATRADAEAAVVHVQGPGGSAAIATFGAESRAELLEAPLTHAAGPFRAVTINWTYRPGAEADGEPLSSALVVPIVEGGTETGTIAAYAPQHGVFGAVHVRALELLAAEAAHALAAARRFAEAQQAMTDAITGLRNRKGYEVELDRAVVRAEETGQPLSLLVLSQDEQRAPDADLALQELAAVMVRMTRASDVVFRRRDEQLGVVLPETAGDAAQRFYSRLREEASRTRLPLSRRMTFTAGLIEWRPHETSDALDARAAAALVSNRIVALELPAVEERIQAEPVVPETHTGFQEQLGREIERARRRDQPLALLVMDVVEGLRRVRDEGGLDAAERTRADVEAHVSSGFVNGNMSFRLGEDELATILTGSTAAEVESEFAALQTSLHTQAPGEFEWLAVSAGITELAWGDDVRSILGRAEHALWRARRAGRGTVVIAMAAEDSRH